MKQNRTENTEENIAPRQEYQSSKITIGEFLGAIFLFICAMVFLYADSKGMATWSNFIGLLFVLFYLLWEIVLPALGISILLYSIVAFYYQHLIKMAKIAKQDTEFLFDLYLDQKEKSNQIFWISLFFSLVYFTISFLKN